MIDSQKIYSRIARFYDWGLWLNGYQWAVSFFVRALPIERNRSFKVFDAGSGTGLYTFAILKHFPNAELIAGDLNPGMLEYLEKKLKRSPWKSRVHIFPMDIRSPGLSLPYPVNLIMTGGVLEHTSITDTVRMLSKHLVPGGLFLNAPVKDNFGGRWVGRFSGFCPYAQTQNLSSFQTQGFKLVKIINLPFWLPISWVKEGHLFMKHTLEKHPG